MNNKTALQETAMQEVVELIYRMHQRDDISTEAFEMLRNATEYEGIPKEKQQIEDAHFEGGKDVSTRDYDDAANYYTTHFNKQ